MSELNNASLLDRYKESIPAVGMASSVLFADASEGPSGLWALLVRFKTREAKENHPLKGVITRIETIVERAMCNCTESLLADLPNVGKSLPEGTEIYQDFLFIGQNESYPNNPHALSSGYQPFVNSQGQAMFNSAGKILAVNEYVCQQGTQGKPGSYPAERLRAVKQANNPTLSKRERYFHAYQAAFGSAIEALPATF